MAEEEIVLEEFRAEMVVEVGMFKKAQHLIE
jgi:hypothetical protein